MFDKIQEVRVDNERAAALLVRAYTLSQAKGTPVTLPSVPDQGRQNETVIYSGLVFRLSEREDYRGKYTLVHLVDGGYVETALPLDEARRLLMGEG